MPRTRSRGPEGESLTIWGEWVDTLAAILHTNYKEIAAHTDAPRMHPSTISRLTRKPDGPTRESVRRIWDALYRIAEERDQHMGNGKHRYTDMMHYLMRAAFFNAGNEVTDEQHESSELRLRATQVFLDILQDNDLKDQIIVLLEEQIKVLTQDTKRLENEIKQLRP